MNYKPTIIVFPDGYVLYHTVPPYMGVYVEKLIERPHGSLCYPTVSSSECLYPGILNGNLPRSKRLKTAKN